MSLPLTSAETDELNAVLRRAAERLERKKVPICRLNPLSRNARFLQIVATPRTNKPL